MSNASDVFIKAENIVREDLGDGIKRQILGYNPDLMMVRVWFEKGAIGVKHQHPHRQVSYVEEGEFEVEINGQRKLLKKGDSFFIPAEVEHGCVCIREGILIDVFTPIRDEFVNPD